MSFRTSCTSRSLVVLTAVLPPLAAAPAWLAGQTLTLPPPIEKGDIVIELQEIATGLTAPNHLVPSSDGTGRLFVANQDGLINIIQGGTLHSEPLLNASGRLVPLMPNFDERGLLGLALHPGFADPTSPGYRKLYTYTSEPVDGLADFPTVPMPDGVSFNHQSVVAEWQIDPLDPNRVDPGTRREIMRVNEPQFNHNGGNLLFRPSDGYLYISLGDGGGARDVGNGHNEEIGNAQDLTNVLGSILRIDPLHPSLTPTSSDPLSGNQAYRVPADNPFVNDANAINEIWAYGLRNPWRFSVDGPTDDMLIADVGQRRIEEINRGMAGGNYGWVYKEGTFLFDRENNEVFEGPDPIPGLIDPIAQYTNRDGNNDPVDGTAIIGGFVYRGALVPELEGMYVFGDFARPSSPPQPLGRLFYLDPMDESGTIRELIIGLDDRELGLWVLGFGLDDDGEMYVLANGTRGPTEGTGVVLKIIPEPSSAAMLLGLGAVMLQRVRRRH
jgi:glucose/arabinose dehydrogenase